MKKLYLLLIIQGFVLAQSFGWQDGGVPVRQGAHIEWGRTGDIGDGNIILGWSDTRTGDRDVYAQKIDSEGNELWGDDGLLVVGYEGRQEDPIMISDGDGGFYVIWSDFRNPPTSEGQPYAQHVSFDGSLTWDADGIPLSDEKLEEFTLNMCKDGNGGAFVTWKKKSSSHFGSYLNQTNAGPTSEVEIISSQWSHSNPSLETAGNGGAMMVWADERNGEKDIYGQRLVYNGTDVVLEWETIEDENGDNIDNYPVGGIPISTASGSQSSQKVTYYSEEYSVVVWQDERNDDGDLYPDIYVTFIDINGEPSAFYGTDALPVVSTHNLDGTFNNVDQSKQTKPRVKADSNGAFVIWNDFRNDDIGDIYIQKITHENNGVWLNTSSLPFDGIPVSEEEYEQLNSRLTIDGNGGVYIVWENISNQQRDIKIKHIDSSGNSTFEDNGMIISDADKDQISPLVVRDGIGGAFTVWEDQRDGSKGLYVQHVDVSGNVSMVEDGYQVFYGIDFNGVLYDDGDPLQLTPKSLYLGEDQTLIFWQDGRGGNQYFCSDGSSCDAAQGGTDLATSYVYGQVIDSNYGDSDVNNGNLLSTFPVQKKPSVKAYDSGYLYYFLGYDFDAGEEILTFEKLDENFNAISESALNVDGTPYANQKIFISEYDSNGNLYIVYAKENWGPSSIWLQVYSPDGNEILTSPINIISSDDGNNYYPHALFMSPTGSMILVYDQSQADIRIVEMDETGILWDEPISIIVNPDNQEFQDAVITDLGIFITWKDFRNSNNDIFAQHISFSGEVLSGESNGISLCESDNDQLEVSLGYVANQNIVTSCWEDFRNGVDWNIYCNEIDLYNHSVRGEFVLSDAVGDQKNPFLFTTIASSIIVVWEDSRIGTNEYSDIYVQELVAGQEFYTNGGIIVSDGFHNQVNPRVDILSDQSEVSYIIYWDDMRSSGKEDLINIFSQKLITQDCLGNSNGTAWVNNCGVCVTEEDSNCIIGCDGIWADNNEAAQDLGCECGLPAAVDYYVDNDGDGLGAGAATSLCNDPGDPYVTNSDDDNDECSGTLDDCGICNGNNESKDCSGVCGGLLTFDQCGICDGDGIAEGACDCDGNVDLGCGCGEDGPSGCDQECGSTLEFDECGVCDDDVSNNNITCTGCIDQDACNFDENATISGDCEYSEEGSDCAGNPLSINGLLPSEYLLMQNYPNPFNPITSINFNIPISSIVSIKIFNINGKKVKTLVDGRLSPGYHQISWNGDDDNSILVSNGIYFYIMETPQYLSKRKMIFIK